jgi:chromosome transmission fidelity protein 18
MFQTSNGSEGQVVHVRYAVRQVLDQELRKEKLMQSSLARQARSSVLAQDVEGNEAEADKENQPNLGEKAITLQGSRGTAVKRDFFGRIINESRPVSSGNGLNGEKKKKDVEEQERVWVSFHEGFSNAVRKPITLKDLLDSF